MSISNPLKQKENGSTTQAAAKNTPGSCSACLGPS